MTLPDRFWNKTQRRDGHLIWTGATRFGYGYFHFNKKHRRAHVLAWEDVHGLTPTGLEICHKCGIKLCLEASHIYAGTHAQNVADSIADGTFPRGEKAGTSKLTEAQVVEIRARYSAGGETHRSLAAIYGVSHRAIGWVLTRRSWSHV